MVTFTALLLESEVFCVWSILIQYVHFVSKVQVCILCPTVQLMNKALHAENKQSSKPPASFLCEIS